MGTKNDPGIYDCHAKAHPDEPMFTLLGRDPMGFHLVRIWAALRWRHFGMARAILDDAICDMGNRKVPDTAEDKLLEALACSDKMKAWLDTFATKPTAGSNAPTAASQTPRSGSTATPNAADAAA
jgi:hypothetical protein